MRGGGGRYVRWCYTPKRVNHRIALGITSATEIHVDVDFQISLDFARSSLAQKIPDTTGAQRFAKSLAKAWHFPKEV